MLFKRIICIVTLLLFANIQIFANENIQDIKQQAIALYTTGNFNEAFKLLDNLPASEKNEDNVVDADYEEN